jgi:hypothetical protein
MAASAMAAIRSNSSLRRNFKAALSEEEMSLAVDTVPPDKELEGNYNIEVLLNG